MTPTQPDIPTIGWVKNDPLKYSCFADGSEFLVAIRVRNEIEKSERWDFDVVRCNCDGEEMNLEYRGGEYYDSWSWEDFEYFALLDGEMPTNEEIGRDDE